MNLTGSQQEAIAHRGSNLLVAASAGSGKTEVLARRCVALIADAEHPCDVDRLLVVTFTRAAAAELRVRIGRMLRAEAAQARSEALRRHLQRQEVLVGTADIGTIDAWCGRIVREHFAEAGVDAEFSVLGEQDALLLRRQALDEVFDAIHRGDALAGAVQAWLKRATPPGDAFLRGMVERLNRFREHLINPAAWFERQRAACAANDAEQILATALLEECSFQRDQLAAFGGEFPQLQPYREQLAAWCDALATPGGLEEVVAGIAAFKLLKPRGKSASEPPEVGEVRERWLQRRLQKAWPADEVEAMLTHAGTVGELTATLLDLEQSYQDQLAEAKQRTARYEFADVLRRTLDLLGEAAGEQGRAPTAIAERLRRRYEHILVDEYQDTSPVQVQLLQLVTRTDAGNRFMVGDVKQSIYGFRQAEPRLFSALMDAFRERPDEGHVGYLSDNFRSHERLLAVFDGLFAQLYDRNLGGTAYGSDERLRAGRKATEIRNPTLDAGPRVEVHVLEQPARGAAPSADDGDADDLLQERIEREAELTAERIRALLDANTQIPERHGDDEIVLRPLRLDDIAVLLRSAKQNAGLVAQVLRKHGIPCATGGREALLDAVEVHDVRSVLALLVNRRQDVPLAAYLRGPLAASPEHPAGSLTPGELLQVRTALDDRDGDFHDAVEHYRQARPDAALADKLEDALTRLERWSIAAREEDVPTLLLRILQESALPLFVRGLPGGAQRAAHLRSLQAFARQFVDNQQGGVAEFVQYLDALAAEDIEPAALAIGDENVVRIMTIHGAKGLEFPVVFLLGTGAKFNEQSQREALQCDDELGVGLKFADYPLRSELVSARHRVIRRRVAQRELEEELRLLYVAVTRAREKLFVIGHTTPGEWPEAYARHRTSDSLPLISRLNASNRLEWVLMAVAAGHLDAASADGLPLVQVTTHTPEEVRAVAPAPPPEPAPAANAADDEAWIARGVALLTTPLDRTLADRPAVLSVSALKELAHREQHADQPGTLDTFESRLPEPTFATATAERDGRPLGTACHRFLEHADLRRLTTLEDVRAQLADLVAAEHLSADEAALVPAEDVAWFGGTEEGKRLAAHADAVRREVPFVYALALDAVEERTIVRGVIDCLVPTSDGLVILDYKTDRPRDDADWQRRLAGYEVQARVYAQAAGEIFKQPVTRVALVFLRMRHVVTVTPAPIGLADLAREPGTVATGDANADAR